MGSVRGLWIINISSEEVLYSKRFPTVEVRFKRSLGTNYCPLPSNNDLINEVMVKCSTTFDEFIPARDSVKGLHQWPVIEVANGDLWPIVCLIKNNLLYVAVVPYEPLPDGKRPPLIRIVGVSAAIALLSGMCEILDVVVDTDSLKPTSGPILELSQFILTSAPFGTPSDVNPITIKLQQQFKKSNVVPKEKIPSWRPAVYKGASKISLFIREQIKSAQYDKSGIPDVSMIHGSVLCKAELEGHPDVILSLTTPPGSTPLDHLIVHPCVQSADADVLSTPNVIVDGTHNRKIRFSAPLETFTLCHYQCSSSSVPIRGFYQMKGEKVVELLVQLKLMDNVKNSFEFCEVHIPFFNRGPIEKVDNIHPSNANISISDNKRSIIWTIGQKFPQKNLEMSLGASVAFVEFPPDSEELTPITDASKLEQDADEKFCVGQNAFCEVRFKMVDHTLSGCTIDHRAMTLLPQIKFKSTLVREVSSNSYRIWNSHGDVIGMPSVSDLNEPIPSSLTHSQ